MTLNSLLRCTLFLTITLFFLSCKKSPQPYDLLIKNGTVYDGTLSPPQTMDIAIAGDKIVKLGQLDHTHALETIDAKGLTVAPGFIDTHTHLDPLDNLIELSTAESQLRQGVTTSIGGPDGRGVPLQFTMKEFLDSLERTGIGINMGFMA